MSLRFCASHLSRAPALDQEISYNSKPVKEIWYMTLFVNVSHFLLRNYLLFNGKSLISTHHLLSPTAYLTC